MRSAGAGSSSSADSATSSYSFGLQTTLACERRALLGICFRLTSCAPYRRALAPAVVLSYMNTQLCSNSSFKSCDGLEANPRFSIRAVGYHREHNIHHRAVLYPKELRSRHPFLFGRGKLIHGFSNRITLHFSLIAYASVCFKVKYLTALTRAAMSSRRMGFCSDVLLVKYAQRHGERVKPIDVRSSDWPCAVEHEPDGPVSFAYESAL